MWLQGHQLQCMIPFWIRLLTRMNQIWVLSEWVQFDEISTLLKILNPKQRREGTSIIVFIEPFNIPISGEHMEANPLRLFIGS